jgi:hypothetical protein
VLSPGRRLTDDEITDLVEAVVDDLDTTTVDPSVSTVRDGNDLRVVVSVSVGGGDQFAALARASEAMLSPASSPGCNSVTVSRPSSWPTRPAWRLPASHRATNCPLSPVEAPPLTAALNKCRHTDRGAEFPG